MKRLLLGALLVAQIGFAGLSRADMPESVLRRAVPRNTCMEDWPYCTEELGLMTIDDPLRLMVTTD